MFKRLPHALALCLVTTLLATAAAQAQTPAARAKGMLTDSTVAPLAATRRVAITNVMVSFQASAGGDKTNTSGLFASKTDTSSVLQMPDVDARLMAEVTDEIYEQLKADLSSNGFEVLPQASVVASPIYQKIVTMAGFTSGSKFGNKDGDVWLVGASGLKPYLAHSPETGKFAIPTKGLIQGWLSGRSGDSSTAGGPTATSTYYSVELPGLEVALAKELNAHVVKATYVVTLGSTKAANSSTYKAAVKELKYTTAGLQLSSKDRDADGRPATDKIVTTHSASAFAQVGLLAGQSRIAFRSPGANTKGEKVTGSYAANFGNNAWPAKDGDVVAALAESLAGGTDCFTVTQPVARERSLLGTLMGTTLGGTGADVQFTATAVVSDAAAYRAEVVGLVASAQREMLALVKP